MFIYCKGENMFYVWFVCLLVGIALPVLSMVLEFFDNIFDFEFDFNFDIDFDFFPTSIKSICLGLFAYGATALITHHISNSVVLSNVIGGIVGYVFALIAQNIMRYLKHNESYATDMSVVLFSEGVVVNRIAKNGLGVVQIVIPDVGIQTFTAREKDNNSLEQGTKVKVIALEDHRVVVELS